MEHKFDFLRNKNKFGKCLIWLALLVLPGFRVFAEGSKDFIQYPGYRLFLDNRNPQQLKVYAAAGETINVGASHVGISGGYIKVYRPDGSLAATFDGSAGSTAAIIFDDIQEKAGPTGGTPNGTGYVPGIVQVAPGHGGIWTVEMAFPVYQAANFQNLLNDDPWNRATHQPTTPVAITAWDITVTTNGAGNNGGIPRSGRVYSNEYVSVISQNGYMTSPTFYVLTKGGFLYSVSFMETDPYRFPITSVSRGLVDNNGAPTYTSHHRDDITRSDDPSTWVAGKKYYYEPQAEDYQPANLVNNKIFINKPDTTMPPTALVTDIFRANTHSTWLFNMPSPLEPQITQFQLLPASTSGGPCLPGLVQEGLGGWISFLSSFGGIALLSLDLNNDGDFTDPVDRTLTQNIVAGTNSILWDGYDGEGNLIEATANFTFGYQVELRDGETHIILSDIENNAGGVIIQLLSDVKASAFDQFYYDHSPVGAPASGGGSSGNPLPTNVPFIYQSNFGDNKLLDYWSFVEYSGAAFGSFSVEISENCLVMVIPDSDGDGVKDNDDLDDDNDGIPDLKEFCNPAGGFSCLPGGRDPSGDADGDGLLNYKDANDPAVPHGCPDANSDGICDQVSAVYDTDGDKVPDHLDLDSDNDAITDLVEAGHNQPDTDGNGVIDGLPNLFGINGLYDPIDANPSSMTATESYPRWDWDGDAVPDHDDLDSDNDGIHDVAETGFGAADTDNDGRIGSAVNPALVTVQGLANLIAPSITGLPIPIPPDKDGDNVRNWHDLDSDNDLIHDVEEAGLPDADDNALVGTGVPVVDLNGKSATSTSSPRNKDLDSRPDYLDLDTDNDGINDVVEANGADSDNNGMPGVGSPAVSLKGIPVGNNIVATSKPNDADNDGVRDYRDLDSDNDGIHDVAEASRPDGDGDGIIGTGTPVVDTDGRATSDAQGNALTTTASPPNTDADVLADFRDLDSDGDAIWDVTEATRPDPDHDGVLGSGSPAVNIHGQASAPSLFPTSNPANTDGTAPPDFRDLDSDNDGIVDADECPFDGPCTDGDGDSTPDFRDFDRDNDGISDAYECETSTPCTDTDNDGTPDVDDLDTDGDGLTDAQECAGGAPCPDADNDGTPNWREYTCHAGTAVAQISGLTSGTSLCVGESVTLTASNGVALQGQVTYAWSGPNNFSYTGTAQPQGPFPVTINNLTSANSGLYTLMVFTEFSCPSQPATVNLLVTSAPQQPSISISNPQPCLGETVTLTTAAVSGANIQYQWFFGGQLLNTTTTPSLPLPNVNLSNSGNYSVKIANGNCGSGQSAPVSLQVANVASQTPALTVSDDVLCQGDVLGLSASGISASNVSYQWFFNNGSTVVLLGTSTVPSWTVNSVTPSNTGTYSVVASANNCASPPSNAETIVVGSQLNQAPVLNANDTPCAGSQLQLTTTAYPGANVTYQWMFNSGTSVQQLGNTTVPNFTINSINSSNSGIYVVIATTVGCSSLSSNLEVVNVNAAVTQTPVLAVADATICQTETISLATAQAGSGVQYRWFFNNGSTTVQIGQTASPNFTINNATVANSGTYSVLLVSGSCNSPISAGQQVVVSDMLGVTPVLSANFGNLCEGDLLQLTASTTAGAVYEWFVDSGAGAVSLGTTQVPSFTINNVSVANSGTYSVQVSISGCVSQPSVGQNVQVLDQLGLPPSLTVSANVICEGETLELNTSAIPGTGVAYEWFFNNGSGSVSLGSTASPTFFVQNVAASNSGIYTVVATNGNCETPVSNAQNVTVSNDIGPAPTLSVAQDVLCEGETLELNSSIFPSVNVTYLWYFNNGSGPVLLEETNVPTFFIQNMATANEGIYTVVVNVGNCQTQPSNAQDVDVTNALSGAPVLTVSASQLCAGETLTLNSSVFPGTGVSYEWYFDNGTGPVLIGTTVSPTFFVQNMAPANAGSYSVVAVSGNCATQFSNLAQVGITTTAGPALQMAVSDNSLCGGETLTLNSSAFPGTGVGYQWFFDNGSGPVLIGTSGVPTFFIENTDASDAGLYSVVAMVGNCETPVSNLQQVAVAAAPDLETTNSTGSDSPACPGDLVQLNVSPVAGAVYQWNGPQGFTATTPNPVIQSAAAGNAGVYSVTLTLAGCTYPAPATEVFAFDGLDAADDAFEVNFNETLQNAALTPNDLLGNVQSWEIRIVEEPKNGTAILLDGELAYVPQRNFYGDDVLVYEICNLDCPNDCDRAAVRISVMGTDEAQDCYVPNIITPNGDGANDYFTVPCLESSYANNNVRIFNRWGDLVFEKDGYRNDWDGQYKGTLLPPGTYFYLIQPEKGNDKNCLQGYFTITR